MDHNTHTHVLAGMDVCKSTQNGTIMYVRERFASQVIAFHYIDPHGAKLT